MTYNYIFAKNKKIIISLCLSASLLTCQSLTAVWGLDYLTSAYSAAASYAAQLKQNAKLVATTAVVGLTAGHLIGSSNVKSSVLVAAAGILLCHSIYKYWDQDHQRRAELLVQKTQLDGLTGAQAAQKVELAQAKVTTSTSLEVANSITQNLADQQATIAQLNSTLGNSSAQLSALDSKATATSTALNAGLAATERTVTDVSAAQERQLADQITAAQATVAQLQTQAKNLAEQQATCQQTVTAVERRLDSLAARQTALVG